MTATDAILFVNNQVRPRMFNGKMDDAVEADWMRALNRPHVEKDSASAAIKEMVDAGTPMRVASFYKALRRHSKPVEAENTKPVLLYSIKIDRSRMAYIQGCPEPRHMEWSYTTGFYASSENKVPNLNTIAYQARWWAQNLAGDIVWAEGFMPEEYENPF